MKLPNGFGTVYKMQGNRRRPSVALLSAFAEAAAVSVSLFSSGSGLYLTHLTF